jgi:hypothetical protein
MERERGVILQEIGQANDTPDDIIFDHFQETCFPDQAMGRPTLGTEEIIEGMQREALTGYMQRHYGPSRMVVAAAGAIEHEDLVEMARTHFADLPQVTPPAPETARYGGGEFREERELDQVHLVLGFPGTPYKDPDHYPVQLLSSLLGGGMSSRLFQEIREKRGLVYSIYSFAHPYDDTGVFALYAGTGEDQVAELLPVAVEELKRVRHDVSEEELARAKAQLRASLLMSLESTGSRCEQIARQIQVHGRVIPTEETKARIAAVTLDDIRRAAGRLFSGKPTPGHPGADRQGAAPGRPRRQAGGVSQELLGALLDAARAAGAEQADALLVRSASLAVQRRLGAIEQLERSEGVDLGLRVFLGNRMAIVSGTDASRAGFAALAERAVAMARVVPEDGFATLLDAPAPASASALELHDEAEPDAEALLARAALAEEAAMAVPGVSNSEGASAGWSRATRSLATSRGFFGEYARGSHSVSATALAGAGTDMQRDYDYASAAFLGDLDDAAAIGRRAGEQAVARLNPSRPRSGVMPVLYHPRVAGSLLGIWRAPSTAPASRAAPPS